MAERKFTKDHEWAEESAGVVTIGITDHAQLELGDVVFVELPEVGRAIKQGEVFGTVESVKAVSELYAPVSGEVIEVNSNLTSKPETINSAAESAGWLIKVRCSLPEELSGLLDSAAYQNLIA